MLGVCAGAAAGQGGATGNVTGKVVQDPGGQGIRKVIVELTEGEEGEAGKEYRTATDAGGVFRFEGVEPGKYLVDVVRAGYFAAKKSGQEWTVTVEAGKEVSELVYKMQATGVISGKVMDGEGDPIAEALVEAVRAGHTATSNEESELGRVQTNDLGEYRIANLKPGPYVVVVTPSPNSRPVPNPADKGRQKEQVFAKTYYPGTTEEGDAGPVTVPSGGTATANIALLANRAFKVSGMVSGVSGGQMTPFVLYSKGTGEYQTNLEDGGRFEFTNVQPGTYEGKVLLVGGVEGGRPAMKLEVVRTPIVVTDADVTGLELVAEAGGAVKGKFRTDENATVDWTQWEVRLVPAEEPGKDSGSPEGSTLGNGMTVTEDGRFEIDDAPGGTYQLTVSVKSEIYRDYFVRFVMDSGRDVADTGFAVTGGATLEVVVSAKGATIEGTVVDADGKPMTNGEVIAVPASGQRMRPDEYQAEKTNTQGQYTLRGLTPGQYLVVALEGAHEDVRSSAFAAKYGPVAEPVELGEGEKKTVALKVADVKE